MIWLMSQIWALLVVAFAIGLATGWWMGRERPARPARNAELTGTLATERDADETPNRP